MGAHTTKLNFSISAVKLDRTYGPVSTVHIDNWHISVCMPACRKKILVHCWVSSFPSKNMKPFLSQGLPGQPGSPGPAGKEGPVVSTLLFILFACET